MTAESQASWKTAKCLAAATDGGEYAKPTCRRPGTSGMTGLCVAPVLLSALSFCGGL